MSDQNQINKRCCAQCDNGGAGSLDATDRPALWLERDRLLARLAEVDALLDAPMPDRVIKLPADIIDQP